MLDLPAAIYGVEKILVHYPDVCIQTLDIVPPNPKARTGYGNSSRTFSIV